jgi:hypothetical protein
MPYQTSFWLGIEDISKASLRLELMRLIYHQILTKLYKFSLNETILLVIF